jgi:hypothetical protein
VTYCEEDERGWLGPGDELVGRLRRLDWPKPDAELRERCWREFQHRVAEQPPAAERRPVDAARPFEYTLRPRGANRGHVGGERLRAARGLSRARTLLAA